MILKVVINEDTLAEKVAGQVKDQIVGKLAKEIANKFYSKYEFDKDIKQIVKELYADHKQEIIDATIERAAKEITRKALPQLIEKLGD